MAARRPLQRISMTIPGDALRQADKLARQWDRSRSWVIGEAIRRLSGPPPDEASWPRTVAEPGATAIPVLSTVPALDPFRRDQLADDLRLTPLARVIAAERTAREVTARSFASLIVTFDRPEDYLAWKQMEAAGLL